MNPISVIIVSWNAQRYLRDCLTSICENGGSLVQQIVVVDNASTDGSPEMVAKDFPRVTLIRADENLGFARGNNLGLQYADRPMVAFVNSDVIVHPGCFQKLAASLEEPQIGLAGPKVFGQDGHIQLTCGQLPTVWNTFCEFLLLPRCFPHWSLFSGFQMVLQDRDAPTEVGVLSGCFWLARRKAIDQVGILDERFFFYAEDTDWCKRFNDAGWKVLFVPQATATHFGGASSGNASLLYSIEFLRANLIYWHKHHGILGRSAFFLLAMIQHSLRLVVRGIGRMIGFANGIESKKKIDEHIVCLRWLLTGKGV